MEKEVDNFHSVDQWCLPLVVIRQQLPPIYHSVVKEKKRCGGKWKYGCDVCRQAHLRRTNKSSKSMFNNVCSKIRLRETDVSVVPLQQLLLEQVRITSVFIQVFLSQQSLPRLLVAWRETQQNSYRSTQKYACGHT